MHPLWSFPILFKPCLQSRLRPPEAIYAALNRIEAMRETIVELANIVQGSMPVVGNTIGRPIQAALTKITIRSAGRSMYRAIPTGRLPSRGTRREVTCNSNAMALRFAVGTKRSRLLVEWENTKENDRLGSAVISST